MGMVTISRTSPATGVTHAILHYTRRVLHFPSPTTRRVLGKQRTRLHLRRVSRITNQGIGPVNRLNRQGLVNGTRIRVLRCLNYGQRYNVQHARLRTVHREHRLRRGHVWGQYPNNDHNLFQMRRRRRRPYQYSLWLQGLGRHLSIVHNKGFRRRAKYLCGQRLIASVQQRRRHTTKFSQRATILNSRGSLLPTHDGQGGRRPVLQNTERVITTLVLQVGRALLH